MTPESEISSVAPGSVPLEVTKWEIYARERALCASGEDAQVRAGYPARSGMFSKLDRKRGIRERIAYLTREDESIIRERRDRLRCWLHHIKDFDRLELFEEVEEDGRRYLTLKPLADLTPEQRMLFEGLEKDGRPIMPGKLTAAAQLAKLDGLDAPTKAELGGPGGSPLLNKIEVEFVDGRGS